MNFEFFYHFLRGSANFFMHTFLIADLSDLCEEETWNPRKVKGELIWHNFYVYANKRLKLTIAYICFKLIWGKLQNVENPEEA